MEASERPKGPSDPHFHKSIPAAAAEARGRTSHCRLSRFTFIPNQKCAPPEFEIRDSLARRPTCRLLPQRGGGSPHESRTRTMHEGKERGSRTKCKRDFLPRDVEETKEKFSPKKVQHRRAKGEEQNSSRRNTGERREGKGRQRNDVPKKKAPQEKEVSRRKNYI